MQYLVKQFLLLLCQPSGATWTVIFIMLISMVHMRIQAIMLVPLPATPAKHALAIDSLGFLRSRAPYNSGKQLGKTVSRYGRAHIHNRTAFV